MAAPAPVPGPRFGLEVEMHGFILTFKRPDNLGPNPWWRLPAVETLDLDSTMIGGEPIFCPLDSTNYKAAGQPDRNVAWTADWGLRAVGDAFGKLEFKREVSVGGVPPQTQVLSFKVAKCTVELQTAAHTFNDAHYWVFARRCMQAFRNTMGYFACQVYPKSTDIMVYSTVNDRLYLVQEFLDLYNEAVEAIQAPVGFNKNRFKLRFSDRLVALANGTAPNEGGIQWTAYFAIQRSFSSTVHGPDAANTSDWIELRMADDNRMFSDVQITYEWDFESLRTQFPLWTDSWGSTWFSAVKAAGTIYNIDPLNNSERFKRVPVDDVYGIKAYIALWKTALIAATQYLNNTPGFAALTATAQTKISILVQLLFVIGGTGWNVDVSGASPKNGFPQMPKTSPASIARLIQATEAGPAGVAAAAFMQTMTTDTMINRAVTLWGTTAPLVEQQPQCLAGKPDQALLDFQHWTVYIQKPLGSVNSYFRGLWKGTFDINSTAGQYANNNGWSDKGPFFLPWANETRSSAPAVANGAHITILLESRYGSNKLNQGFNPYVSDAMFKKSYLDIMNMISPTTQVANQAAANTYFANIVPLTQVFPIANGPVTVNGVVNNAYPQPH